MSRRHCILVSNPAVSPMNYDLTAAAARGKLFSNFLGAPLGRRKYAPLTPVFFTIHPLSASGVT